jgi:hypothetical protein
LKEHTVEPATAVAPAYAQAPGNDVPEQILSRWSWGPFFLGTLWVFWNADQTHKIIAASIFVGNFIPILNFLAAPAGLAFAIYLGIKGNRLMAANRPFASLADFVAVQTAWAKWGVIVFLVSIGMMVLFMLLFGLAMIAAIAGGANAH